MPKLRGTTPLKREYLKIRLYKDFSEEFVVPSEPAERGVLNRYVSDFDSNKKTF